MRYPALFFITLLLPLSVLPADHRDYPVRPGMNFQFHHLSLDLVVESESRTIRGTAEYEISPRQDDIRDITLFADNMNIERIRVSGNQVEFRRQGDSLLVELGSPYHAGRHFKVEITYEARPRFGVHFSENGTVWTSMLPKSNRHWLPGFDHPRAEVTTTIHLRVAEGREAVASGHFLGEESLDNGYKEVGWKSDVKLPLSEIGFVTGSLDYKEILAGTKRVRLYAESGMLDAGQFDILLENTYNRLRETGIFLLYEFPYNAFNLVALNDDRWETRSYAPGIGYIFNNRGDLASQIAQPVYAQWFGMHQRPEQWKDAEATLLHQAWLADNFGQAGINEIVENLETETSSVYNKFSPAHFKSFIQFAQHPDNAALMNTLSSQAGKVLVSGSSVMGWDDYARFWYEQTGQNRLQKPDFPEAGNEVVLTYGVDIRRESMSGQLLAYITPEHSGPDESFILPVILVENGNETVNELEFSGLGDTLTISGGDTAENVAVGKVRGIELNVSKPFTFWLHQLRHDPDSERRKQAALAIGGFSDQPDLQLALNSVLNREENSEVKAAILKTLGEITGGAAGVQNWFLSRLDDENEAIQRESLRALKNYPGDEIVKRDVFEIISLSDDIDLVNEAITVYRHLVPESDFVEFTDQFLSEDEDRLFTYTLINELYETSETGFANDRVNEFLSPDYSFNIRFAAFRQLTWNDFNTERWADRVKTYIADPDPRIRFLMANRMDTLLHEDRDRLLIERQSEEKDGRVLQAMMP